MIRRVGLVVVLALVVFGLFRLNNPHSPPSPVTSPAVGATVDKTSMDSTWFCAAGSGAVPGLSHQVIVTSLDRDVTARITIYGAESGSGVSRIEKVPAHTQHAVSVADIGPGAGGVTVEIAGGPATVAHRLLGDKIEDQSDCTDDASNTWYFASADTELVGAVESTARLWLLNPFPTDASVDVRVTFDNGVRIPPKLRGIIVPAGSSRVVDLNEPVPRVAQFAFSVEARGGRVTAELAQTVNGEGLRLEPGVPSTAPSWVIADSFAGTNLAERINIYNPSTADVAVSVAVIPDGVDPASFPEPFLQDVPARRFVTIDLSAETRLPAAGLRYIRIDSPDSAGVVVSQVMSIVGPGGDGTSASRPSVAGGLASSSGSSAQATRWYVSSLTATTDSQPVVVVANLSPDGISVVTLTAIAGGKRTVIADKLEVPAQQSLAIDVSEATLSGPIAVEVSSSTPVVVSGRTTSTARAELALIPALPDRGAVSKLPAAGG